jgi:amino acid transporter
LSIRIVETAADPSATSPTLRRRLSLPLLCLYGIGVTIGAGIYVLVGKVSISTGMHAPLSFVIAALLAGFTAFSYAELSSRLPKSAGEAMFVQAAFGRPALATAIGFLVMATGIVSSSALSKVFE